MKDFLKAVIFIGLFLVPFLPVYVENSFFFPFITGKNFAFRIIIEIVFASWVLLALADAKYRPRFSWLLAGFGAFLIVMFFANLFGEYPAKSFMSNFERMDGYVTLVHLFLYVLVAGSMLTTEKVWSYFLHTSIAVALYVALYGLAKLGEGGRVRVDSQLGNAAYMAVYMLFHIFFLLYFIVRSKVTTHRIVYGVVALLLVYTLLLTGTRGTALGLVGGVTVFVGYVALFGRRFPQFRKIAIAGLVALVLAGGLFYTVRDSQFVQDTTALRRIATIDLGQDLQTRSYIWNIALKGFEERPVLGWGQGNFNYVFNTGFDPRLWNAESWFDRTHDIFLDWLIAGGVLGLITYLSIFAALLYYLFWQPLRRTDNTEPTFTVLERGVFIGLIAAYFMHNLVVFDNIISYIFFGSLLALVHSRVAKPIPSLMNFEIDQRLISQFAAPLVILAAGATVYFVNVPGIRASSDIIDAMQASTVTARLTEFHNALDQQSFADQEIVEQMIQNAINIVRSPNISNEEKHMFAQRTELEMLKLIEKKPGDARLHTFFSTFYRALGAFPQAQEQAALARSLSPLKQGIITEQGIIEVQMGNKEAGRDFFKEAFELATDNVQARVLYAASLVSLADIAGARELLDTEKNMRAFATNDYALAEVDRSGDRTLLKEMFEVRMKADPGNAQNRASFAFLQYEGGDTDEAVATLEQAAVDIPSFATSAECFIGNLKAGKEPSEGCQQ